MLIVLSKTVVLLDILGHMRSGWDYFWLAGGGIQANFHTFNIFEHHLLHRQWRNNILFLVVVGGLDTLPADVKQAEQTAELKSERECQDLELGQASSLSAKHCTKTTGQHTFGISSIPSKTLRLVGQRCDEPLAAYLVLWMQSVGSPSVGRIVMWMTYDHHVASKNQVEHTERGKGTIAPVPGR